MHKEILSENQRKLLPLLGKFSREYYLAGGTAIALHIGHRRSIDFGLFKFSSLNHKRTIDKIAALRMPYEITRRVAGQMNVTVNSVNLTFLEYPYPVTATCKFENVFKMPELINLAAMKAYALGRRSKWKDYVDLYYILKDFFPSEKFREEQPKYTGSFFRETIPRPTQLF